MDFNHFLTSYMPDTSIGSRQHFKNMLEECVTAEKLGYATVSIPEHHLITVSYTHLTLPTKRIV